MLIVFLFDVLFHVEGTRDATSGSILQSPLVSDWFQPNLAASFRICFHLQFTLLRTLKDENRALEMLWKIC